jgi:hypothetical protein
MDWLTGFTGSLTGAINGIANAYTQVQQTTQQVQQALNPSPPMVSVVYGPPAPGSSSNKGTLIAAGIALYFLLR